MSCGDAERARRSRIIEELESYTRGEKLGPFARPGWLRELFTWTQKQVAPLGLRVTGGFRQLNASPTSASSVWKPMTARSGSRRRGTQLT